MKSLNPSQTKYLIVSAVVAMAAVVSVFIPLAENDFRKESVHSVRVVDRNGILLREFLNDRYGRAQWRSLGEIAPSLLYATIAVEDKRFRYHPGVDPVGIARALLDNLKAGGLRSGGSTLTQQVIRNIYRFPRTVPYKLVEMWYALRLERMMNKDEILEQYLNRAPYGNQLIGVEAAAQYYFNKPARELSIAESAFLAALPNAPSSLNPYRNFAAARIRQQHVLNRMFLLGFLTQEEFARAHSQPIVLVPPEVNFRAPHAVQEVAKVLEADRSVATVYLTVDYIIQNKIQLLVRNHLERLKKKNVGNAAVVVFENATGAVVAMIGSANFFDETNSGQVNGVLALRQPGSALKPFMYGVALERGYTAATMLADIPTQIPDHQGNFIPENYDRRYHGPVSLRAALACSYNVPAVRVLNTLGVESLLERLRQAGITSLTQPAKFYGLGLTLGNGEVRLLELANAYRAISNGGIWTPAQLITRAERLDGSVASIERLSFEQGLSSAIFDLRVAAVLADILSDASARRPAFGGAFRFPFPCAVKTGTTKDFRDNWAFGFTTMYTVGVWVGNFDGTPMRGVSGVAGAGQIFSDVMLLLHEGLQPGQFHMPDDIERWTVCVVSGLLPTTFCQKTAREWFLPSSRPWEKCDVHRPYRFGSDDGYVTRVYEMLPAEYSEWVEAMRMPQPPADAVPLPLASYVEGRKMRSPIQVLSPTDGEMFKIDPVLRLEYQTVKISGVVPDGFERNAMIVVGDQRYRFDPRGVWWQLQKGKHRIRIETAEAVSRPVTIYVE